MDIEIWSDIMCPFCYIGKRHLEAALKQFDHADEVKIQWHSFQLDPSLPKPSSSLSVYEYLAERKGMSLEQSMAIHENVLKMAEAAGLHYRFDRAIVANSFDAHRLIQLAKTKDKSDEIEERLFRAYFMEGKDLCDNDTLVALGKEVGLEESELQDLVNGDAFTDEVKKDIWDAQQVGARGVPFFVFDMRYAMSGAQPVELFLSTLVKVWEEAR